MNPSMLLVWIPLVAFGAVILIWAITQFIVFPLMGKPNCFQACQYKPPADKDKDK